MSGCRPRTGLTASNSDARCRIVDSANQLDTSCTLIGSPSLLVPNRIDNAGSPVTLNGTVAPMTWKASTVWPSMTNSVAPCS